MLTQRNGQKFHKATEVTQLRTVAKALYEVFLTILYFEPYLGFVNSLTVSLCWSRSTNPLTFEGNTTSSFTPDMSALLVKLGVPPGTGQTSVS